MKWNHMSHISVFVNRPSVKNQFLCCAYLFNSRSDLTERSILPGGHQITVLVPSCCWKLMMMYCFVLRCYLYCQISWENGKSLQLLCILVSAVSYDCPSPGDPKVYDMFSFGTSLKPGSHDYWAIRSYWAYACKYVLWLPTHLAA